MNMLDNPLRFLWSKIWRLFYLIPGQFNSILSNIFKYINMDVAKSTLKNLGIGTSTFTYLGLLIVALVIVFQLIWNHYIGIDNDNIGENKLGTTIKKSIFAILIACTSISMFTYLDQRVTDIITGGVQGTPKILSAKELLKVSANDFLKMQLDENDLTKVKGCDGINTNAEYLKKDKNGNYSSSANSNDIYNCYEVNSEYHDMTDDSFKGSDKLKQAALKGEQQGIGKSDTHIFATNDATIIIIGIVSTISLSLVLLHFFKIKYEIIIGILLAPSFAAGLVSRKSSAWQQFFKALIGKFISPLVMVFLLIFSIKFLEVSLKAIYKDFHSGSSLFLTIFETLYVVAMFGVISTGSVYVNNFIGQSGATGSSGGSGVIAGAGIGATASNIQSATRFIPGKKLASKGAKAGGKYVGGKIWNGLTGSRGNSKLAGNEKSNLNPNSTSTPTNQSENNPNSNNDNFDPTPTNQNQSKTTFNSSNINSNNEDVPNNSTNNSNNNSNSKKSMPSSGSIMNKDE